MVPSAMWPDPGREYLLAYLKEELGPRVELGATQVLKQRHDYVVLNAQLRHPSLQVVVKLAGPEARGSPSFDRTAALHRLVAEHTALPMPEIIAVDSSLQRWPWRILVRTYCPGQEWATVRHVMSAEQLRDATRQIGDATGQLHSIRFGLFGELDASGKLVPGTPFLPALEERSGRFVTDDQHRNLFLSVLQRHQHLFGDIREACLCHEDLHGYNILFQQERGRWRLATILDFDKAWAGHHEIDLARLELWRGMTSEEFWRAYGPAQRLEPGYLQRRPIHQLLWCLEFAQPTREHLADTQRVCAELGIPPVVFPG